MPGQAKDAGAWGRDEIRNMTGVLRFLSSYDLEEIVENTSTGVLYYVHDHNYETGVQVATEGRYSGGPAIDASRVVPTGPQNVPQHIWTPYIIYLGLTV